MMVCCIISIKSVLILSTVYKPGASMMMSGRKTLAETRKVEELKSQQEAEGVQVVSLTWTRLNTWPWPPRFLQPSVDAAMLPVKPLTLDRALATTSPAQISMDNNDD
jgi:hypothetical protein